jgi:hypothetical protein
MSKYQLLLLILVFNLLTQCSTKKQPKLRLLFSTTVTDNSSGGSEKYNTRIAMSDSIFLLQEFEMGRASGYSGNPVVQLWIHGIEKKEYITFDSLVNRYKLKQLNLNEFVKYESDVNSEDKIDSLGFGSGSSGMIGIRITLKRLTNGDRIKFIDSANSNQHTLQLISKKGVTAFSLEKKSSTMQMGGSFLKLYNVARDKKEELFILTPEYSYWGFGWFVQVYEIQ